ncbi:MAG TPA: hypothetical protein VJN64_13400, partial [Terriglobales bacterium]|nr:hypothetical protein [Terriglobales bacterium]
MSRIRSKACIASVILLLFLQVFISPAEAQYTTATGTPTFTTALPVEMGFTNVANGNLHLEIPLASFPQRGRLVYNARLVYDSLIWKISGGAWQATNVPNSMGGWRLLTGGESGTVTYTTVSKACDTPPPIRYRTLYSNFIWTAPNGTKHRFPISTMRDNTICQEGVSSDDELADDSTGYSMSVTNYTSATIYAPDGTQVYPTVMDTNGNFFSKDTSGNIVDTLGRTPITVNASGNPIIYSILNTQGGTTDVKVTTTTVSADTSFGQSGVAECTTCSFTAIQSITFADGSGYSFTYDSGTAAGHFGELTSMTLRTGGTVNYGYTTFADGAGNHSRWLTSKAVGANTWNYTPLAQSQTAQQVTVKDCLNNSIVYSFSLNNGAWMSSANYTDSSQANLGTVTNSWDTSNTCAPGSGCNGAIMVRKLNSVVQLPGGLSKTVTYSYASSYTGQLSEIDESDYGTGTQPIVRKTLLTYAPLSNAVSKPSQIKVEDGQGNRISEEDFYYDQYGPNQPAPTSGVPQHNAVTGSRGNLTTISRWLNTIQNFLSTTLTYDDTGNVLSTTDPGQHTTQLSYADNFSDGVNHGSNAFLTQVTLPDTNSPGLAHHTTRNQYDFSTGLPTASIDQNGQQTTLSYDTLLRPFQIGFPDGGQTTFTYSGPTQSVVQSKIDGTRSTYATTILDNLGRISRTAIANGEALQYGVQDFCYDANGRLSFQAYPYQSSSYTGAVNCSAEPGDTFAYDGLGRPTKVTHADGSSATTTYQGRARQIQDEGNGANPVTRILQSDGLGRLVSVCEVSATTLLGSGGTPADCGLDLPGTGFLTSYGHDLLGNLTSISQGTLNLRSFGYDSLSRMISESHPEWVPNSQATYTYDNDGLLISRTRPAPDQTDPNVKVTTNYGYDALHRLLTRSYTGDPSGTPAATFNYDEASPLGLQNASTNPIGRLTSEISGNAKSALAYDPMGRVVNNWQCTPLFCPTNTLKLMTYQYDLAGDMISSSTGADITLSYGYNVAPRLTDITSSYVDAQHPATLLSGMHYGPFGPVSDTLGNGFSETFGYNARGALQSYTSAPYSFSLGFAPDLAITSANDSQNGNWIYGYDEFNRLVSSNKNAGAQTFTYDYDRYGNRWHQNAPQGGPAPQYLMDNTMNRISGSGVSYDALGNVTNDGLGNAFTYDAENRLIRVVNAGGTTNYAYDAEGRRVENGAYEFLYDLSGRVVTQFLTSNSVPSHGFVYAGRRHVVTYSAGVTSFMHSDWLGTKRVMTTLTGIDAVNCTGLPFGDALNCVGHDR